MTARRRLVRSTGPLADQKAELDALTETLAEALRGLTDPMPGAEALAEAAVQTIAAALAPVVAQHVEDARAQVAAPVLALAEWWDTPGDGDGPLAPTPSHADLLRAAVSDAGVEAHEQRIRADAWDEGYTHRGDEFYGKTPMGMPNPYRARAVATGDEGGNDE